MKSLSNLFSIILLTILLGVIRSAPILNNNDIDWDIDKDHSISEGQKLTIKEDIIKELNAEDQMNCHCSKILFPIICDNYGKRHNNICEFLCHKKLKEDLKPRRILLETVYDDQTVDRCKL